MFNLESLAPMVGHLAYAAVLFSFLVRSMAKLRALSIVASIASIIYSAFAAGEMLWTPILWNVLFISINVWQLVLIYLESRVHELGEVEGFLHKGALKAFSTFEVKSLVGMAAKERISDGATLIRNGEKLSRLFILTNGSLKVEVGGQEIARLAPGNFVGEMSFLTGDPARADARAAGAAELLAWDRSEIEAWLQGDGSRAIRLQTALGAQLVGFLSKSTK